MPGNTLNSLAKVKREGDQQSMAYPNGSPCISFLSEFTEVHQHVFLLTFHHVSNVMDAIHMRCGGGSSEDQLSSWVHPGLNCGSPRQITEPLPALFSFLVKKQKKIRPISLCC